MAHRAPKTVEFPNHQRVAAAQIGELRANTQQTGQQAQNLRSSQERDRQQLRDEWRKRNDDRREAWDKVKASQNLRRQVADRFAPRDGSGQGRNAGTRDRER